MRRPEAGQGAAWPLAAALLAAAPAAAGPLPQFGQPLAPGDLAGVVAVAPDGAGLPPGQGTAAAGREVYAAKCAGCHGDRLQGVKNTGASALAGGRGTLASAKPLKTVESFWPYATTLFDYVKRAMPFNAPGSLADDEVYAVSAFILAEGHVIAPSEVMDARSLPRVRMPNAGGFLPDPRPPQPPSQRPAAP